MTLRSNEKKKTRIVVSFAILSRSLSLSFLGCNYLYGLDRGVLTSTKQATYPALVLREKSTPGTPFDWTYVVIRGTSGEIGWENKEGGGGRG